MVLATGALEHDAGCIATGTASDLVAAWSTPCSTGMRAKRPLAAMLGDTSMGMINGYFGPRLLARVGFTEHKVDQAWLIEQGKTVDRRRIDDAFAFVRDRGVEFHWTATTSPRTRPASSCATTSPCSTCSTSSGPTASAGSTSSA